MVSFPIVLKVCVQVFDWDHDILLPKKADLPDYLTAPGLATVTSNRSQFLFPYN